MKKHIYFMFTFVVMTYSFSSCQKVIQLKLNTSSSQIVIQGNIYDHPGPYEVNISKSVNFDQSNVYPAVTGATVTIADDRGYSNILTETSPGTFVTSSLQGFSGRTYTLTVNAEGQMYTANSTLPNPVSPDSIYFEKSPYGKDKLLTIKFLDPGDSINFYRLVEFVNRDQQQSFNIVSDKFYNGNPIIYRFSSTINDDKKLATGDSVTVWLESIDKNVYEYFRTLRRDGGQSTSPANAVSNISNGALGYFSASPVRKISIVVP